MDDQKHHLLICTVGGSPDPIIASIRHWKPARVLFVPSEGTQKVVEEIRAKVSEVLTPGNWDITVIGDAEDFNECARQMRSLDEQVEAWHARDAADDIIVDWTGGTKCMSAALAVVSRRWLCRFSYVGGSERTKGGVGTVESGTERVLVTQNPWNALGYQAIEDAGLLFDQHAFMPAAKLLTDARKAADDESVRRTLSTIHQLCEGYGLWDRFQHKDASARIDNVLKNVTDLRESLGRDRAERVLGVIKKNQEFLPELVRLKPRAMVRDLLANANRRGQEKRYDDGVARLYRAIEWIAQLALEERHQIADTGEVTLDRVPEPLRERWRSRAEGGMLRLGLQDDYELLDALDDETGQRFRELGLRDRTSSLNARNSSILAHGFTPVAEKVFQRLWEATMRLGNFSEQDLPNFPRLTTH